MFRDDDPGLARLRAIALGFPGTCERIAWGRPTFRAPRMFAIYGGTAKVAGATLDQSHSVLVKADPAELPALLADPRFFRPAYLGPHGWVGLDLTGAPVDWREVTELVDASWRQVAPRRRIAEFDGG